MSSNANGKKQHTVQEYRQAVKILKLNALQLVDQNKEIETKIDAISRIIKNKSSQNISLLDQAIVLSSKTDILQKYQNLKMKDQKKIGKDTPKQMKKSGNNNNTSFNDASNSQNDENTQNYLPLKKEQALREFKEILNNKCLNYEMLFRCCDKDQTGQISVKDFVLFIGNKMSANTSLTLEKINFLAQCLDEDCSGTITTEEYNKCITSYNLNESPHKLTEQRALEKEVMFKIVKLLDAITKSERMSFATVFDQIIKQNSTYKSMNNLNIPSQNNILKQQSASPSRGDKSPSASNVYASLQQIQDFLEYNKLSLKDMEVVAMCRVLDPTRSGFVEKKAFVREMNSYYRMVYEIDIDREMQSFASLLKQFKIDPIHVFKIADIEDTSCVSKTMLIKAIIKLAPRINAQLLDHFLSIIDINQNGEIDENEYFVALSQDESNVLYDFNNQNVSSSFEKQKILDKFHTFMAKKSLTPKELFCKIDRNGNNEISLLELKFALLDLGFELPQITQIMRVFDTNSDQKIDEHEFYSTLENAKMLQHGFEKEIQEVNKNRKGSQAQQEQRSQAELSQIIQQSAQEPEIKQKKEDPQKALKDLKKQGIKNNKENNKFNKDDVPDFLEINHNQEEPMKISIPNIHDMSIIQNQEDQNHSQYDVNEDSSNHKGKYNITINKINDHDNQNINQIHSHQSIDHDQYQDDFENQNSPSKGNKNNILYDIDNGSHFLHDDNNLFKNMRKQSSKIEITQEDEEKINLNKSHNSVSSRKSVKFNLFDEAEIQALILNEENIDFNKFYEDLDKNVFEDKDFPPTLSSLTADVKTFEKAKTIVWKRASEIYTDLKVFYERAEPDDIKQGGLGDCYFLSSLSVLAERENLIKRLFVTKDPNPCKIYSVWICKDSEWQQIILDDYIPCRKEDGMPSFSNANGNELWVILLEKCYAKIYGTYDKIEAGQTVEAIKDLTGAPGKSIKNDDINLVWDLIITSERKNYLLTCGSQTDDRGLETKKETGIVSSHAYGILDAQEVQTAKGLARLIKMRNPWGSMEWNGDWSDKSKLWTPKIREQLKYFEDRDDGIFWMDVKDYVKEFSETSVNYLHENYFYSWYKLKDFKQKQTLFQFVVKRQSHCYIMLSQKSDRHFSKTKKDYKYSMLKQFLYEINPTTHEPIKYIGDNYTPFREGFIEATLAQGTYVLAVEVQWIQDFENDAVISIYSESEINLQVSGFEMNSGKDFSESLCSAVELKDFSQSKTAKQNTYEQSSDIIRYSEQFGGYIFFKYINKSSNCTLEEELSLEGNGFELIPRDNTYEIKETNSFSITVPPKSQKIALYKMIGDGMVGFQYSIGTGYIIHVKESIDDLINKFVSEPDKGEQRQHQGKNVEYYFKVCQYNEGFILLYQNRTKNLIGMENIEFENTNLSIVNSDLDSANNKAIFEVKPGQNYGIILQVTDKKQGSGLGYSEVGTQFKNA